MKATAESVRLNLTPSVHYVLRIADTCLIHAQRLAEWCGHGPVLEEDIALTNMALDLLGQARALLAHAAGGSGLLSAPCLQCPRVRNRPTPTTPTTKP